MRKRQLEFAHRFCDFVNVQIDAAALIMTHQSTVYLGVPSRCSICTAESRCPHSCLPMISMINFVDVMSLSELFYGRKNEKKQEHIHLHIYVYMFVVMIQHHIELQPLVEYRNSAKIFSHISGCLLNKSNKNQNEMSPVDSCNLNIHMEKKHLEPHLGQETPGTVRLSVWNVDRHGQCSLTWFSDIMFGENKFLFLFVDFFFDKSWVVYGSEQNEPPFVRTCELGGLSLVIRSRAMRSWFKGYSKMEPI